MQPREAMWGSPHVTAFGVKLQSSHVVFHVTARCSALQWVSARLGLQQLPEGSTAAEPPELVMLPGVLWLWHRAEFMVCKEV